jgi:alginate O-acetyltransferase complex protein AlgI
MRNPLSSETVAEFWGGRWNLAFKQLVYPFLYSPLKLRIGSTRAMVVTFLVSGLIHEIVISLPANGGWGLPTLYFLIQPIGMSCEHQ